MGNIIKEIDALYDTWLGRWKATRQFLTTLRNICFELKLVIEKQDRDNTELWETISDLRTANEALSEELSKKLSAPKDAEGFQSANQIMDKIYYSQQAKD